MAAKLGEIQSAVSKDEEPPPSTIGEEKSYNPFMRFDNPAVIEALKLKNPELDTSPESVFTELRKLRDDWTTS